MTLNDFLQNAADLTPSRQKQAMTAFLSELARDIPRYESFIFETMTGASLLEDDDYFGTEGMNI